MIECGIIDYINRIRVYIKHILYIHNSFIDFTARSNQ